MQFTGSFDLFDYPLSVFQWNIRRMPTWVFLIICSFMAAKYHAPTSRTSAKLWESAKLVCSFYYYIFLFDLFCFSNIYRFIFLLGYQQIIIKLFTAGRWTRQLSLYQKTPASMLVVIQKSRLLCCSSTIKRLVRLNAFAFYFNALDTLNAH